MATPNGFADYAVTLTKQVPSWDENNGIIIGVFLKRSKSEAIRSARHDAANQAPEIIAMGRQIARQPLHQLRMARLVLPVHLVERHHQSTAEQTIPHAVHDRPGKPMLLLRRESRLDQPCPAAVLRGWRRFLVLLQLFQQCTLRLLFLLRRLH